MVTLYTIGHSTRSADEFLELLAENGIELLLDIRRFPASRRHPHFDRAALERALAGRGVRYRHVEELGGHRTVSAQSRNSGIADEALRGYADHTASETFARAVERVLADARAARTAVMCAEARPSECHRRLLADWLAFQGHDVVHVLGPDLCEPHALDAGLARDERGVLVWRARQATLFD